MPLFEGLADTDDGEEDILFEVGQPNPVLVRAHSSVLKELGNDFFQRLLESPMCKGREGPVTCLWIASSKLVFALYP